MTNRDFPPLAACLQTLEVLIRNPQPNGIVLAENAIDEYLVREPDLNRRTGDLHVLDQELEKLWKGAKGKSLEFVNVLTDFTAKKMRELQPDDGHNA